MGKFAALCLIVVGLINIAPVVGVLSAQRLESAYSIDLASNELIILMRHRALLFGILGAFIIYSAFNPAYQAAAMIMAGVSMVGFAVLVILNGDYNDSVSKVLMLDIIGIVFLIAALALKLVAKAD